MTNINRAYDYYQGPRDSGIKVSYYQSYEENLSKLIPDGIGTDQSLNTLKSILSFAQTNPTIYLPSHDPQIPSRMENKQILPNYQEMLKQPSNEPTKKGYLY